MRDCLSPPTLDIGDPPHRSACEPVEWWREVIALRIRERGVLVDAEHLGDLLQTGNDVRAHSFEYVTNCRGGVIAVSPNNRYDVVTVVS